MASICTGDDGRLSNGLTMGEVSWQDVQVNLPKTGHAERRQIIGGRKLIGFTQKQLAAVATKKGGHTSFKYNKFVH
jgi:hypothetical protein